METGLATPITALNSIQFVVGQDGRPTAVQMGVDVWNLLLDWLEDHEDRATVRGLIPMLRQGPQQSGALRWEEIREEWNG